MLNTLFIAGVLCFLPMYTYSQLSADSDSIPENKLTADSLLTDRDLDSLLLVKRNLLQIVNPADSNLLKAIENYDLLISRNWEVSIVKVKSISEESIEYLYPLNTDIQTVDRRATSQILYANGRREIFHPLEKTNPADSIGINRVVVLDEKAWENITVVYEAEEIPADLVLIKTVDTRFDGDRINTPNKTLESSSLIILRKKAVNVGGSYLLVTNKKFNRPYGDFPYAIMEGKVYGIEQLEE